MVRVVISGKASPMSIDPISAAKAEAIAWHVRLREGCAQDWDDFIEWLERDPGHSTAYDAVALDDASLDDALGDWTRSMAARTNDNRPLPAAPHGGRRWMAGGMVGLAAAAALGFIALPTQPSTDYYDVATPPGQTRIVTLAGRDRVALNGGTRMQFDHGNPRFASLLSGEAAFSIVHDPQAPFELVMGDDRVVDVGTNFNVIRSATGHTVEVAEGSVLYNPAGERIAMVAGQKLTSNTAERRITLSRKPISEVGGWQRGRLSYRSATLAEVAADLSRTLGTPITVQPAIAGRSFTGTIEIDRNENRMFARLGPLLDVDARRGAGGWTLGPVGKAAH